MKYRIPFNKPFIAGKELYYIAESVLSGGIAGDGIFSKKCHRFLEDRFGVRKVLLTHSCTAALEMAAILLDVGPDDEVILPSYTFVSTANAFWLRGARLVFADIRADTLNIDEEDVARKITPRTKVIVPVHYSGVGCEMDPLMSVAAERGIRVVEDAAQGLGSRYKGRFLGTIGDIGAYSFHETKNVICGEGGAIVVNDERLIERAEIIREKGTNRSKFFRGEVDKYTWVDIGSSYLPSDLLAAFLYAQLEQMDVINNRRREIWSYYHTQLFPLAERGRFTMPYCPPHCESNSHMFYLVVNDGATRDQLLRFLKEKQILAVFHYLPLHRSPMGRGMGYREGDLPITESLSSRILRLPFFYEIRQEEQDQVISAIGEFFDMAQD